MTSTDVLSEPQVVETTLLPDNTAQNNSLQSSEDVTQQSESTEGDTGNDTTVSDQLNDSTDSASAETNTPDPVIENRAPAISNAIADQSISEDSPFNFTIPGDAIQDPDNDNLDFSVSLANGSSLPSWLRFDAASRQFSGTPGNDDVSTITISLTASDPNRLSVTDQFDITVKNVNDAPVLNNVNDDVVIYNEGDGAVVIDQENDANVIDIDSVDFAGGTLTLTIASGGAGEEDVLNIRNQGNGAGEIGVTDTTITYAGNAIATFAENANNSGLVITFNSNATLGATTALLHNITFENSNADNPTLGVRTVDFTLTDGDGGFSATASANITLVRINDIPVVSELTGDSLDYAEGDGAVIVDQNTTVAVTDVDSDDFSGGALTVTFANGTDSDEDVIAIRNQSLETGQISVAAGEVAFAGTTIATVTGGSAGDDLILTFNASADTIAITALLASITYENTDTNDPTAGTRTLDFTLTDGDGGTATTASITVTVADVNDAPLVIASSEVLAYTEGASVTAIDQNITLSDSDDSQMTGATVTISSGLTSGDNLALTVNTNTMGNISAAFADGVLTISGTATITQYQTALRAVTYNSTNEDLTATVASRIITFAVTDANSDGAGAQTSTATRIFALTPLNDVPIVTATSESQVYTEGGDVTIDSGITISDVDDSDIDGAIVTISDGLTAGDTLALTVNQDTMGSISASFADGVLAITGQATKAQYQMALQAVSYSSSSDDPTVSSLTRTITYTVTDADSDGAGAQTSTATRAIVVSTLSDAPVVTTNSESLAYMESGAAIPIDVALTIADADDTEINGATVTISAGLTTGDALALTVNQSTMGGISASFADGVLTLTGQATIAQYQTALQAVTYSSSSEDPTVSASNRTITYAVTDADSDGVGAQTSTATRTIVVTPLSDAPIVITNSESLVYTEGGNATAIDAGITLTDIDDTEINGTTVTISDGLTTGDTLALAVNQSTMGSISTSFAGGVLTLTGQATKAQYQTALQAVTYSSSSDDPTVSSLTRTLTYAVTDANSDGAGAQTTTATRTIVVTPLSDAPLLTTNSESLVYTESGDATAIDADMIITDVDDIDINGATVTISAGLTTGDALALSVNQGTMGSISASLADGVLTLTGQATKAQYQTALQAVTYSSSSDDPTVSSLTRTITYTVTDANSDGTGAQTSSATRTIAVTALNDAPIVTTNSASLAYMESGDASVIDASITISDIDDLEINGATVTISDGLTPGDTLALTVNQSTMGGLSASFASGVLTLTGQTTKAQYQTALQAVTYSSSSEDPTVSSLTRTITFSITDADSDGVGAQTSTATRIIAVTPLSDAPVVTTNSESLAYTEGGDATAIDSGITISDVDDIEINGTTVTISEGFTTGDTLALTVNQSTMGSISASFADGVLTLTGQATKAQYQTALQAVTFNSTSEDPAVSFSTRTIAFVVTDANSDSTGAQTTTATRTIAVTPLSDAPVVTTNSESLAYTEGGDATAIDTSITITDVDDAEINGATVTVSDGLTTGDTLALTVNQSTMGNLSASFSGGVLTLTGQATKAQYQTALQAVTYSSSSEDPTVSASTRTIAFAVTDANSDGTGAQTTTATRTIAITPLSDAPIVTTDSESLAYTEGGDAAPIDSSLTIADIDDIEINGATVTISTGLTTGDTLALTVNQSTMGSLSAAFSGGVLTLTGQATKAQYQTALQAVTYSSSSDDPTVSATTRTITFAVTDANSDGTGAQTSSATRTIALTALNDAPIVTANSESLAYTEGDDATAIDAGITISDVDDIEINGATITISDGITTGDTLALTVNQSTMGSLNAGFADGVLTLTGQATKAQYQTALQAVTYTSSSENPTVSSSTRTITYAVTDADSDSAGAQTNTATRTIAVIPLSDAPVVTTNSESLAYTEGSSATVIDAGITITDVDDTEINGTTVTISDGLTTGDTLALTVNQSTMGSLSASFANGVLTLTGQATKAQYQTALQAVTYNSTSEDPTVSSLTRTIAFAVTDANSDSTSVQTTTATRTITVTPLSDAPVVTTNSESLAYTEGGAATAIDSSLTITDVDDIEINGTTVTISDGFTTGDTLALTVNQSTMGSLSASFSGAVLTLTGQATKAQYQTALQAVTYNSTSEDPTVSFSTRTIAFAVTDANSDSTSVQTTTATRTIAVTPLSDAPVVTTNSESLAYTEGSDAAAIDTSITITDVDDIEINGATVTISAGLTTGDTLALTVNQSTMGSLSASFSGGVLTLTGQATKAQYQTALQAVTYISSSEDPTISSSTRTIAFAVTDANSDGTGAQTTTATRTIAITPLSDAPIVTANSESLAYTEGGDATAIDSSISITDVDDIEMNGATVTISTGLTTGDTLALTVNQSTMGSLSADFSSGVLTLTGQATKAQYQTALQAVTYNSTSEDPTATSATRTITYSVTDANSDSTGAQTSSDTRSITVTALNDAPSITASSGAAAYTENAGATVIDSGITVTDVDDSQIAGATVTISSGLTTGDTLALTVDSGAMGSISAAFESGVLTISGTATVAQYEAALQAVTFSSSSEDPTANSATRTITYAVTDANSDSAGAQTSSDTRSITVTPLNDAPSVTASSGSLAYTENASATVIDSGIALDDVDDNQIAGATVTISSGLTTGDILALTVDGTMGSINAAFESGVLTISGTATVAQYQAALQAVTYNSSSEDPTATTPNRTITYAVTDANSDGAGAQTTSDTRGITVTALNDAPTVTASSGAMAYTENVGATVIDGAITLDDVDDSQMDGATVTISSGLTAGDILALTVDGTMGGVSAAFESGVLTISGTATVAQYQAALQAVTFRSSSEDPTATTTSRTITYAVTDANSDSVGAETTSATRNITITAINDAPSVTTSSGDIAYTENASAVVIDTGITLADNDDSQIAGATVTISSGLTTGDTLALTVDGAMGGVSAAFESGVLTISGTATVAQYEAALQAVTYRSSSEDPTASSATRTITYAVTDANSDSAGAETTSATRNIALTALSDAPVITASSGAMAYTENVGATVIDSAITLSDSDDSQIAGATVTLSSGLTDGDILALTVDGAMGGVSAAFENGVLTISGTATVAQYEAALQAVTYNSSSEDPTATFATRTITYSVTDANSDGTGAQTSSDTRSITVTPLNDAPSITATSGAAAYTENASAIVIDSGITVTDVDDSQITGATVTISSGLTAGDTLALTVDGGTMGSISAAFESGVLTISGTATVAQYEAALQAVTFISSSEDPTATSATRTITYAVTDANSDSAGAQTSSDTRSINVTALSDAPSLTASSGALAYTENASAAAIDSGIALTDVDDSQMAGATVTISSGLSTGDILALTVDGGTMGSISAAFESGVLTISGTATVEQYQTALRAVTYSSSSEDPTATTANRTITYSVTDANSDGAGAQTSTDTRGITVTPVNDTPQVTASSGSLAYTENAGATVIDSGITLSDADDAQMDGATVTISSGFTTGDVLALTINEGTMGAVMSANFADQVLTISGTATVAQYQAALQAVTYISSSDDPTATSAARTITYVVTDANSDGAGALTGSATRDIAVTAVNDASVIAATGTTFAYTENDGAQAIDTGFTITDADDSTLTGATVTISGNYQSGEDSLAFSTQNGISGSYNAGVMTLSGTTSISNYITALRSVTYANSSEDPNTTARTMSFQVNDGSDLSNTATRSVSVTAVNDAPITTASGSVIIYTEGGAATVIDSGFSINEYEQNFNGGSLKVEVTTNATNNDALSVLDVGLITESLYSVKYNGTEIGTVNESYQGSGGNYLLINLNSNADNTSVQALTRAIGYNNTVVSPTISILARTVTFTLSDSEPLNDTATQNVYINTVPVIANLASDALAYDEGDGVVVIDQSAAVTVTDTTSADFGGGSLTVTLSGVTDSAEDFLAVRDQGAGAGNITVSGSDVAYSGTVFATFTGGSGGTALSFTLDSDATTTAMAALLANITFEDDDNDDPTAGARTVAFVLTDGDGGTSVTNSATVTVSKVNDAPVVSNVNGDAFAYTEGDGAVIVDQSTTATIADVDSVDFDGGTLTVSFTGGDAAEDTVAVRNQGTAAGQINVSGSNVYYGSGTLIGTTAGAATNTMVVTLNSNASLAATQALISNVTYTNTDNDDPTAGARTINFVLVDGDGDADTSNTSGVTVTVSKVNDAPTVTPTGTALAYTWSSGAVVLDDSVVIGDVDDANLASAYVRILSNYQSDQDVLTFVDQNGITGSYSAANGAWSLSGTATVAEYQTAIQSITYTNSSATPNTTDRLVWIQATDDDAVNSAWASRIINVTGPSLAVDFTSGVEGFSVESLWHVTANRSSSPSNSLYFGQETAWDFATGSQVAGSAVSPNISLATALSPSLTFNHFFEGDGTTDKGYVEISNDTQSTWTELAQYTATTSWEAPTIDLSAYIGDTINLRYRFDSVDGTNNSFEGWYVDDVTVSMYSSNQAPGLTGTWGWAAYTEGDGVGAIDTGLTTSDTDGNYDGATFKAEITTNATANDRLGVVNQGTGSTQIGVDGSTISYEGATIGSINATYQGVGTGYLLIDFNSAATNTSVQALARAVGYWNTSASLSTANRTVSFTLNDGEGAVSGTTQQNISINTRPTITNLDTDVLAYSEGDGVVIIDQGTAAVVADTTSANFNGGNVTVAISAGEDDAEDVLSINSVGTGTGEISVADSTVSYETTAIGTTAGGTSGNSLVITLNASATPTAVGALLNNITYQNTDTDDPTNTARTIAFAVNDGSGGISDTSDVTVNITKVNDEPTFANLNADSRAYNEGAGVVIIDQSTAATLADVDSADFDTGTLTVSIVGSDTAEDFLAIRNQGTTSGLIGISGSDVTYGSPSAIIGTYTGGSGGTPLVITFNATANTTSVAALVQNITFEDDDTDDPTAGARTINFVLVDGDGDSDTSATNAVTITVAKVNDAATITNLDGDSKSYNEGDGAVVIDQSTAAVVADVDSSNFNAGNVTVAITAGGDTDEDVLAIRSVGDGSGEIRVTGTTVFHEGITIADYAGGVGSDLVISLYTNANTTSTAALLSNITYTNSDNDDPTAGARTIEFTLNDGDGDTSATHTTTFTVSKVNDAPTIASLNGNALAYNEGAGAQVIDQGSLATIADVDSSNFDSGTLTVSISAGGVSGEDQLAISNPGTSSIALSDANVTYGGLTIGTFAGGTNGSDLVITFNTDSSVAAATALIQNITFKNIDTDDPTAGERTVTFVLTDGDTGTSSTASTTVTVAKVNDAPTIGNLNGDSFTFTEGDVATLLDQSGDAASADVDSSDLDGGTLTISASAGGDSDEDVFSINDQGLESTQIGVSTTNITYGGTIIGTFSGTYGATLVVTLNAAASFTAVNALISNIKYQNTDTDNPTTSARTVDFVLTDGDTGVSNTYQTTVNITPVNDAPTLTNLSGDALAYNEGAGAQVIDQSDAAVVADVDSDFASGTLTVSISANRASAEDVIAVRSQDQISVSGTDISYASTVIGTANTSGGTGTNDLVITFNSSASVAAVDALVRNITYENIDNDDPTASARTIDFTLTDGDTGTTATLSTTVTVAKVNDIPTISALDGDALAYSEGAGAVIIDQSTAATAADVDSANFATGTLTVSIASGGDNLEDVLAIETLGDIALDGLNVTYGGTVFGAMNSGGGSSGTDLIVTLDSDANSTVITALLASISYENTDTDDPTAGARNISFVLTDGDTGTSATSTVVVTVAKVNDASVVAGTGGTLAYTENGTATIIDSGIAIADVDDTDLTGATVTISNNYQSGEDTLAFTNQGGITGSYESGVMTLSGSATLSAYQTALNTITYVNSSNDPSELTRTITFQTNDGTDLSNSITRDIAITAENDTPIVTAGGTALTYTDGDAATVIDSAITGLDYEADYNTGSVSVQITANPEGTDSLTVTETGGISISGTSIIYSAATIGSFNGGITSVTGGNVLLIDLTAAASNAAVQALLRAINFSSSASPPLTAARTVTFTVTDDQGASDTATQTININIDPIINALDGNSLAYTEGNGTVVIDQSTAATVTDGTSVDFSGGILTVAFTAGSDSAEDILAISGIGDITLDGANVKSGATTIGTWNSTTGGTSGTDLVVTFNSNATPLNISGLLQAITFTDDDGDDPTAGARTVTFVLTDGDGGTSTTSTATVTVSKVNDPSVLAGTEIALAYTENDSATIIDSGLTITEVDNANLTGATVTISSNYQSAEDTLAFTNQGGITGSYDAGVMTLSGSASVSAYQTALRSVTYVNSSNDPSVLTRTITVQVNDGTDLSNSFTRDIAVTAENDPPIVTAGGTSITYNDGDAATVIDSGITGLDYETNYNTGSVSAQVTVNPDSTDTLAVATTGGITLSGTSVLYNAVTIGSFNGGKKTVGAGDALLIDLNANADDAGVQALLRAITFVSSASPPPISTRTVTFTVTDADGAAGSATQTININTSPIVNDLDGNTLAYSEGAGAVVIDQTSAATVTDTTSANFSGGTLTVSLAAGSDSTEDVLAISSIGDIALDGANVKYGVTTIGTWNSGSSGGTGGTDLVVTFDANANPTNIGALLQAITFADTDGDNPTAGARTVTFVLTDGDGGTSATNTTTVTVTGVNDASVLAGTAGALAYTENASATIIDSGITIADVDDANLTGATVTISSNYQSAEDTLAFTNQGGISGSYAGGVMTLSGSATLGAYQTALRSVTYVNSSDDPSTLTRTVSIQTNDGTDLSNTITRDIEITAENDAPTHDNSVVTLDGVDDFITIPDAAMNSLSAGTFEAWVFLDNNTDEAIIAKQNDGSGTYGVFSIGSYADSTGTATAGDAGRLYFHGSNGVSQAASTTTIATDTWTHIAVSFDNSAANFYVDGIAAGSTAGDYSIGDASSVTATRIGSWGGNGGGAYLDGKIDDVRIWNTVKSQASIQNDMNKALNGNETNLSAYWKFNEASGAATDSSSNSYSGTLANGGVRENIELVQVSQGTSYKGLILGSDIDGDDLSYAINTQPGRGTLTLDGNTFIYTNDNVTNDDDSFIIDITDENASTSTETFDLDIV